MMMNMWMKKTEDTIGELNKMDAGGRPGAFVGTMFGALCFMFETVKAQREEIERHDEQIRSLARIVDNLLSRAK